MNHTILSTPVVHQNGICVFRLEPGEDFSDILYRYARAQRAELEKFHCLPPPPPPTPLFECCVALSSSPKGFYSLDGGPGDPGDKLSVAAARTEQENHFVTELDPVSGAMVHESIL